MPILNNSNPLSIANGGTGATNAASALINLGISNSVIMQGIHVIANEKSFRPSTNNPALLTPWTSPTNQNDNPYFNFAQSQTCQIYTQLTLPSSVENDNNISCRIYFYPSNNTSGTIVFNIKASLRINGSSYDQQYGTSRTLSISVGSNSANTLFISTSSLPIVPFGTSGSLSQYEIVISRVGTSGGDTYAGDARVTGVLITGNIQSGNDI